MKHIFLPIVILFILITGCDQPKQLQNSSTNNMYGSFSIKRGTNIAHWLSQSNRRGMERSSFFTEKDIAFIKSAGFDHIRLPVDEQQLWDSTGKRYDEAFQLLDNCMNWANRAGLRVVLDLHILRSHHFNAAEKPLWTQSSAQDQFIQLW